MTVPQVPGVRVRARRDGSVWTVRATRAADLAALVIAAIGAPPITRLEVEVDRWRPPAAGWLGQPAAAHLSSVLVERSGSGARVVLALETAADPGAVVSAALRCLRPSAREIGPELTFTPGLPPDAATLADAVRDVLLPGEERDPHVRRADTLLVADADTYADVARDTTVVVGHGAWVRNGDAFDVCVDPHVHRPIGRRSVVEGVVATATVQDGRIHLSAPGSRITIDRSVTPAQAAALRAVDAVVGDVPVVVARQLSALGVLVAESAADLPDPADPLAWQAASVHERRHALRQYGPSAALDAWPEVSVVLVTHRPDHLEHAIRQVTRLRYPRLEIVVGIHGDGVDGARVWDLLQDVRYPSTVVPIDGTRTLGEALQLCCDRAQGALVTKMDDDDHYGAEHIWDLVLARQYSGAQIVGKALDWIHLQASDTTVFRPVYGAEKYAGFVAGGTILISRSDLGAVGGWRPVPKSVDRALLDRVLADGGLVYRTHGLGYVYVRRDGGHTATVRDEHFLTKTASTQPGLLRHVAFGTEADA